MVGGREDDLDRGVVQLPLLPPGHLMHSVWSKDYGLFDQIIIYGAETEIEHVFPTLLLSTA